MPYRVFGRPPVFASNGRLPPSPFLAHLQDGVVLKDRLQPTERLALLDLVGLCAAIGMTNLTTTAQADEKGHKDAKTAVPGTAEGILKAVRAALPDQKKGSRTGRLRLA